LLRKGLFSPQLQVVIENVEAITVVIWLRHFLLRQPQLLTRTLQITVFHLPLTRIRRQNQKEVLDEYFGLTVIIAPEKVHATHHLEVIQFKFQSTDHPGLKHEREAYHRHHFA
jgi:hypothetical protein